MSEKKKNRHGGKLSLAAKTEGNRQLLKKKRKKSNTNTEKANRINSNGAQKFNLSTCQQKKRYIANRIEANLFNQIIRIRLKFNQNSGAAPLRICKGKNVSNDTTEQMDEAVGIHFQEEVIMEILSRLPVRSLLRFKYVSKSWKALISDPYFTRKHRNHAKNDHNSQKLLIGQRCVDKDDIFNFYCSSLSSVQVVEDEQKLDCPSTCKPVSSLICCCCDGLVLLGVSDGTDKQLLLWNPSTRESIELTYPEFPLNDCVCGLGYDASSDDYKILMINLDVHERDHHEIFVEILALKSCSWRKICKYPTGVRRVLGFRGSGMDSLPYVNGSFHWLGLSQYYTIVLFNISTEVYGEMPLPERMCNIFGIEFVEHGLSILGGMLCFYSTYNNWGNGTFKMWVMKDYGVKESWIELLTIQDSHLFHSARPRYMFADGEVLLRYQRLGRRRSCNNLLFQSLSIARQLLVPKCIHQSCQATCFMFSKK